MADTSSRSLTPQEDDVEKKHSISSPASEIDVAGPSGNGHRELSENKKDQPIGVTKIECLFRVFGNDRKVLWTLYAAIIVLLFVTTFQGSTTYYYQVYASSDFTNHGQLLGIIFSVVPVFQAVCQPFVSKICDVYSRSTGFLVSTLLVIIGFTIMPAAQNGYTFAAGAVFGSVGTNGLSLVTSILLADISPLQWRAFAASLGSLWCLVTAWIGADVAAKVGGSSWRWGYGMFTILIPVVVAPIYFLLAWAEVKAKKIDDEVKRREGQAIQMRAQQSQVTTMRKFIVDVDLVGLLLLALSWVLMLLPLSLASSAKGGWKNPSMIAMIVCGAVIHCLFALWEWKFASQPMITARLFLNRTFLLGVVIDFFYYFTGYLRDTYYLSYVYVIKDWSDSTWTNFGQVLSMGLCGFALILGLVMRYTHRYKFLQIFGLAVRILGLGLTVAGVDQRVPSMTMLVMQQLVISLGSACSVLGTQVATQASVPHEDMAQIIAQLSLWTQLGGAIGSAITSAVWTNTLPTNMARAGVPVDQIPTLYTSIVDIHALPYGDAVRQACIDAYNVTVRPLFITATATAGICLIAGIFMPNFFLGRQHNCVENTDVAGRRLEDDDEEAAR